MFDSLSISKNAFDSIKAAFIAKLTEHHKRDPLSKGMSREALRSTIRPTLFNASLAALIQEKKIVVSAETVSLPTQGAQLSEEEKRVRERFLNILASSGLEVLKLDELIEKSVGGTKVSEQQARKILKLLYDTGEAVKVTEDLVFSGDSIQGLTARLRSFADRAADRSIDVTAFKELAGVFAKICDTLARILRSRKDDTSRRR